MSMTTTINCPNCNSQIAMDIPLLLSGTKFTCPNSQCQATISLSSADRPVLSDAIEKVSQLKRDAEDAKNDY